MELPDQSADREILPDTRGRLLLRGLRFFGRHGNNEAERRLGSHFTVDLELTADIARAAASDRLEDGLDYSKIYEAVRLVTEEQEFHLLETLASRIADSVLAMPRVERVLVRVTKEPRRPAQTVGFAVEISRP
ncbi:MAG: dihydroneopterin aldolase [Candidatus Dormibacteria bacterium]